MSSSKSDWDEDRRVRRREVETTGTVGCRTTTVRRENRRGEMVTQRIREAQGKVLRVVSQYPRPRSVRMYRCAAPESPIARRAASATRGNPAR